MMPNLIDVLNMRVVQEIQGTGQLAERRFDEKFHILQSPQLFLPDLSHFRTLCDMRANRLAVAYIDIDDFKEFNTKHTEVAVDRNLLPRFMMAMEAHVFNHGYAYRFGGDEYVLLLPNFGKSEAVQLLRAFKERLARLEFPEIDRNPTVSIGLCVIDQDCFLTDSEVLERANRAKQTAKSGTKDGMAEVTGPMYSMDGIGLISEGPSGGLDRLKGGTSGD